MTADNARDKHRREHVRVETSRACEIRLGALTEPGTVVDLSARGCAIVVDGAPTVGDVGEISLPFLEWTLDAHFSVRDVRDGDHGQTIAGVRFEQIDDTELELLVREVFMELSRQLHKRQVS